MSMTINDLVEELYDIKNVTGLVKKPWESPNAIAYPSGQELNRKIDHIVDALVLLRLAQFYMERNNHIDHIQASSKNH